MARANSSRGAVGIFALVIVLIFAMAALVFLNPSPSTAPVAQDPAPQGATGLLPDSPGATSVTEPTGAISAARSKVTGWMPYWATPASLDAVLANKELFDSVSPFWFQVVPQQGKAMVKPYNLNGGVTRESVRAALKTEGIKVIPSIVDDSPARFLAQQLRSPKKRTAFVRQIVNVAVAEKFDGIDLDLENFAFKDGKDSWAKTRPAWVAFVKQLSKGLKAEGKVLTVTTPPIYNRDYTPSSGYWVYDWESIAPYIYRLRVMTYDYSFDTPGPIGPLDWATQVMDFATTVMPARKVEMGVPAYGRNWVTKIEGTCPSDAEVKRTYLNMQRGEELAKLRKATPQWDAKSAESTYSYTLSYTDGVKSCTVYRTVWFQTAESLSARSAAAAERRLGGIAIWSVNEVSPQGWVALK